MTLRVPYSGFADAVKRTLGVNDCYLHEVAKRTILTAGHPDKATVVISSTPQDKNTARTELHAAGLKVYDGLWSVDDDQELLELPYVAAVSYIAEKGEAGVWVDAYATEPSQLTVTEAMYEEMANTGDLKNVSFDQFLALAKPTVIILRPDQLLEFVRLKLHQE